MKRNQVANDANITVEVLGFRFKARVGSWR